MEEKPAIFEANRNGATNESTNQVTTITTNNDNHGWQKVTYAKRQKKTQQKQSDPNRYPENAGDSASVFRSLEEAAEERRRRILEAQKLSDANVIGRPVRSDQIRSDDDDESGDENVGGAENGVMEVKKAKPKKEKKPKVTVAEAASKIDAEDLEKYLAGVTASYESQQDIQLMRFADYFGRAFSGVTASQFPWAKMFRESTVSKIADVPLTHINETVYKTSVDWINHHSYEALNFFMLWSLDRILSDLASYQTVAKVSKKPAQQVSSKSQVAIFVVLAMVLRRKPDVLIGILPTLREKSEYQGQDKLPIIVWMITQACYGDLAVGLYAWAHNLLPLVGGKSSCNPQSRDLILQLVERILSAPKAHTILVNNAVKKGERLIPPSSLEMLMRVTYPASSARVKATERFEAIYPILKSVALTGSSGSKAMKQTSQQIMNFAVKAAGEGIPDLSNEAIGICIWCLTQSVDSYKQWEMVYQDNLEASVSVLRKISQEWKAHSGKLFLDRLKEILKSFRCKNEKAMVDEKDPARKALFKDAEKHCKVILGRLSRRHGCVKSTALIVITVAVGAAVLSSDMEGLNWSKLAVMFSSHLS